MHDSREGSLQNIGKMEHEITFSSKLLNKKGLASVSTAFFYPTIIDQTLIGYKDIKSKKEKAEFYASILALVLRWTKRNRLMELKIRFVRSQKNTKN